jgi:rubrerythrin
MMPPTALTLKQVLEVAVAIEERGAKYYSGLASKFGGEPALAETFDRLAKDELSHAAQFRKLAAAASPDSSVAPSDPAYYSLRAAAVGDFFSDEKAPDPATVRTPADALAKALELEKSTLFYYRAVEDAIGASPELSELIAAEKAHLTAIMRVIVSDAKFRGTGDPW